MNPKQLLAPSQPKLILFSVFVLILFIAHIQGWGFCKDCGIPKPLLYDFIQPFSFWLLASFLFLPLLVLTNIFPTLNELIIILYLIYAIALSILFTTLTKYVKRSFWFHVIAILCFNVLLMLITSAIQPNITESIPDLAYIGYLLVMPIIMIIYYFFIYTIFQWLTIKIKIEKYHWLDWRKVGLFLLVLFTIGAPIIFIVFGGTILALAQIVWG